MRLLIFLFCAFVLIGLWACDGDVVEPNDHVIVQVEPLHADKDDDPQEICGALRRCYQVAGIWIYAWCTLERGHPGGHYYPCNPSGYEFDADQEPPPGDGSPPKDAYSLLAQNFEQYLHRDPPDSLDTNDARTCEITEGCVFDNFHGGVCVVCKDGHYVMVPPGWGASN